MRSVRPTQRVFVPPGGNRGNTLSAGPARTASQRFRSRAQRALGTSFRMRERGWSTPEYSSVTSERQRYSRPRQQEVQAVEKTPYKRAAGFSVSKGGDREAAKKRAENRENTRWLEKKKLKLAKRSSEEYREPTKVKQAGR